MPEDRENESLPYPKMDMEFHRKDENYHGISYMDIITAKIHLLVKYRCCFCGAENRDDSQSCQKVMKHINASDRRMRIEEETKAVREIKNWAGIDAAAEIELNIITRQYEKLGLQCSCARCGKKQPWSDFRLLGEGLPVNLAKTFLMLVFVAGIVLVRRIGWGPRAVEYMGGAIFILLMVFVLVPCLVDTVHNMLTQRKSLKLEEEYRPEISIVYRSD